MELLERLCSPLESGAWACPRPGFGVCGRRSVANGRADECGRCVVDLLVGTGTAYSHSGEETPDLWWCEVQQVLACGVEVMRRRVELREPVLANIDVDPELDSYRPPESY